jgi:competence protein ComGC
MHMLIVMIRVRLSCILILLIPNVFQHATDRDELTQVHIAIS